jgi:C4-dicarboxylate transporter DctQ subunit
MFFRLIDQAEEAIISLLLVSMTLLVFIDVVLRFGFNAGMIWSEELTLHMSAWFVLFGASYGLKVGAHIGVDALVRVLSPLSQRVLTGIAVILSLIYCGLFIYGAWIYLAKMNKIGIELEDLPIQAWIAHSILLIGFVLLGIRLLELLWKVATGRASSFGHKDEAEESMRLAEQLKREEGLQ